MGGFAQVASRPSFIYLNSSYVDEVKGLECLKQFQAANVAGHARRGTGRFCRRPGCLDEPGGNQRRRSACACAGSLGAFCAADSASLSGQWLAHAPGCGKLVFWGQCRLRGKKTRPPYFDASVVANRSVEITPRPDLVVFWDVAPLRFLISA